MDTQMKANLKLVQDTVSYDTIAALEALLKEAKQGNIVGIGFAAIYRMREYVVDAVGEAHRNPTFARGLVAALDDKLKEMVHA